MYYVTTCPSPVGVLTLACDKEYLTGLWIEGQKYFGGFGSEEMVPKDDCPVFDAAKKWLTSYFKGERPDSSELQLRPAGSLFRQTVWELLRQIPYGEVMTYGAIAKKAAVVLGKEAMSGQAVGGAVGHNPISIIIPCHRVISAAGSLTGYAGGIEKKVKLLKLEGVSMSGLVIPENGTAI